MNEITVPKAQLLSILKVNRGKHRAIFEEALEGYHRRVVEELQARLEAARAGTKWDALIVLVQPENHTKEYDRAIQMLEMDINETVILDEKQFTQFVQDEWGWTDRFLISNSNYSQTAVRATADRNQNRM